MPATLQITAPISEGSSGGPVLNLKGEVVGVAAAYPKKTENLNFAIPLEQMLVLKRIKPVALDVLSNPSKRPSAYDSFMRGSLRCN
jgi:S1-C subfamily serine protease